MAVICFFFTPFPDIMGKAFADRVSNSMEIDKHTSAWEHLGSFLSAFFGTCGFGVIVVLAHTGVITWQSLVFNLCGGLIIIVACGAAFLIVKYYQSKEQL
jgi:hypothetical protein